MNRVEAILWCLCFTIAFKSFVGADGGTGSSKGSNPSLQVEISRGMRLQIANNETSITVRMSALLSGNEVEQRSKPRLKFKDGLKKIGMAIMMAPVVIQLMSLPGALATIKMSLLRSLFVGKMALLVILFNIIKNSQRSEVVVVHKPEYHDHYYHSNYQPEDDDQGWFRR